MKLTFKLTCLDGGDPYEFTVEGATPLQCLALVEARIMHDCSPESTFSGGDSAFSIDECIEKLSAGETYSRRDFSTPEENFDLIPD